MFERAFAVLIVMGAGCGSASADLVNEFAGYATIFEVAASGLTSSYGPDTKVGLSITGSTISTALPTFGPEHVLYPSGVGAQPSPGGTTGRAFDQGVLGLRTLGDDLEVKLATGIDAESGYFYSGWNTWYGQGDVFLTVADDLGISHFALLSRWARGDNGVARPLGGSHFDRARALHVGDGDQEGLEGHLVLLDDDTDVTIAGGAGAYTPNIAPAGLDVRVFAAGGTDLGDAGLAHSSLTDFGQAWYVQTWTIPLSLLSDDAQFELALHAAPSCANDQIGGVFAIPEPGAFLATLLATALLRPRRS